MTIDTSTTAGKIAVMQAFERGEKCETRLSSGPTEWKNLIYPSWDWAEYDYRIKPREPMEFYANIYQNPIDGQLMVAGTLHNSLEGAARGKYPCKDTVTIKVREVIE